MFIFGWGPRETLINSDAFDCPVCKKTTQRKHVRQRSWMSFFFIPILPISSSRDFIRCQACQSIIPIDSYLGQSNQPVRLSRQALVGMLCGLFSLLTFCIARISIPNAICAIALGHVALRDIRKNHPNVDGRSLADAESVFYQTNLEFSSDGRSLAATSDSARDTIKIFRIGQSKLESTTHEEPQP